MSTHSSSRRCQAGLVLCCLLSCSLLLAGADAYKPASEAKVYTAASSLAAAAALDLVADDPAMLGDVVVGDAQPGQPFVQVMSATSMKAAKHGKCIHNKKLVDCGAGQHHHGVAHTYKHSARKHAKQHYAADSSEEDAHAEGTNPTTMEHQLYSTQPDSHTEDDYWTPTSVKKHHHHRKHMPAHHSSSHDKHTSHAAAKSLGADKEGPDSTTPQAEPQEEQDVWMPTRPHSKHTKASSSGSSSSDGSSSRSSKKQHSKAAGGADAAPEASSGSNKDGGSYSAPAGADASSKSTVQAKPARDYYADLATHAA